MALKFAGNYDVNWGTSGSLMSASGYVFTDPATATTRGEIYRLRNGHGETIEKIGWDEETSATIIYPVIQANVSSSVADGNVTYTMPTWFGFVTLSGRGPLTGTNWLVEETSVSEVQGQPTMVTVTATKNANITS